MRYGVDYSSHTSAMVECGRPIAAEYRWAPSRCRLAELNATKLDLMLAGRRVFVIGDSLGMIGADVTGLFLQACIFKHNGIPGSKISCPSGW